MILASIYPLWISRHWRLVERHEPIVFRSTQTVGRLPGMCSCGQLVLRWCMGNRALCVGRVLLVHQWVILGQILFCVPFLRGVLLWKYSVCLITLLRPLVVLVTKSNMRLAQAFILGQFSSLGAWLSQLHSPLLKTFCNRYKGFCLHFSSGYCLRNATSNHCLICPVIFLCQLFVFSRYMIRTSMWIVILSNLKPLVFIALASL